MMRNEETMPTTRIVTEILPRWAVSVVQISPCSSQYKVYMDSIHGVVATAIFSARRTRDSSAFGMVQS